RVPMASSSGGPASRMIRFSIRTSGSFTADLRARFDEGVELRLLLAVRAVPGLEGLFELVEAGGALEIAGRLRPDAAAHLAELGCVRLARGGVHRGEALTPRLAKEDLTAVGLHAPLADGLVDRAQALLSQLECGSDRGNHGVRLVVDAREHPL